MRKSEVSVVCLGASMWVCVRDKNELRVYAVAEEPQKKDCYGNSQLGGFRKGRCLEGCY